MTSVRSSRVFFLLLLVALSGVMVQMYRTFLVIPQFQVFALRVVSLFLEALPFLLAGAVVTSIAREVLPSDRIAAFCRRRRLLGLPLVALAGFFLPIGELRLPGVAGRLHAQGMPAPHLIAALLAIPLLNPVVVAATIVAFPAYPDLVIARFLGALLVAIVTGALLAAWTPPLTKTGSHEDSPVTARPGTLRATIDQLVQNSLTGFLFLSRYFIVAALVVGLVQSVEIPIVFEQVRSAIIPATLVAVGLAYLLSVPAAADAFVARGLLVVFPAPALTGFLIVGPLLNLRIVPVFGHILRTGHLVMVHITVFALGIAAALATALLQQ